MFECFCSPQNVRERESVCVSPRWIISMIQQNKSKFFFSLQKKNQDEKNVKSSKQETERLQKKKFDVCFFSLCLAM